MSERVSHAARAACGPLVGLAAVYTVFGLTPWGRALDSLSYHGRIGAGWHVRAADLAVLETISTATLALALAAFVVLGGLRGRWSLGLRAGAAVLGAILSAEVLKFLLPGIDHTTGAWRWLTQSSFPSGHAVIVASVSLGLLSVSSEPWRRRLVGPLAAWTAIAATATVTVGWHRPSDVAGSLLLATAWHRALGPAPGPRPARPLRPAPPSTARFWWAGASILVLGAAVEGVLTGRTQGDVAPFAYVLALAVLLAAALLTLTPTRGDRDPGPARAPAPGSLPGAARQDLAS
jgi:membrane-associated phospholipid phosphatase